MSPRIAFGLAGFAAFAGLAATLTSFGPHAFAQPVPDYPQPHTFLDATVNDPPGKLPDPTHIKVELPNQIKWKGNEALLYGNPTKAGDPYGLLVKLKPGQFSAPHTLSKDRWVFVVSGTLWVSDGKRFDPKSTYPVADNNFVTNLANTTFFDGNRAGETESTVIFVSGMGSADNHVMGEYSKHAAVSIKDSVGAMPDVSHITISPTPTTGNADLYGGGQGATTEGTPYGVIQTWTVGRSSSPHFHPHPRYIYVIKGPWWVSSSNYHDTKLTYPVPTGSFVEDLPQGIHWDGNRMGADYTTRLYITGVAPATNRRVDEDGKVLPPQQPRGGGRRGGPQED